MFRVLVVPSYGQRADKLEGSSALRLFCGAKLAQLIVVRFTSLTKAAPVAFETNFFHHRFWADCNR